MTIFIYFGIISINLLYYSFNNNKKKNNSLILLVSIILIGLIFVYGLNNTDMNYYELYYNTVNFRSYKATEISFYLLVYLSHAFNLGLVGLRLFVYLISTFFISFALKRMCYNYHLYIVFYMFFLFFINDIQLRNLVATSVAFYSFTYLTNKYRSIPLYIVFIVFASTFHTSALFYIAFLIGIMKEKKVWIILVSFISLIFEFIVIFDKNIMMGIGSIVNTLFGGSARIEQYFDSSTNGSFAVVLLVVFNICISWFAKRIVSKYLGNSVDEQNEYQMYELIMYVSILQLITLPMLWLNVEFYRFPRNSLFLIYILLVDTFVKIGKKRTYGKVLLELLLIFNMISWIYISYVMISDWNSIFQPIFYQNYLLNQYY